MTALRGPLPPPAPPTFVELFTPKLVTVFREGYGTEKLKGDLVAGLTVAIVALPLSMAIAIASGVSPDRGLYAAIIGGLLVSLLGGSRFQIGGPAGAFIVLVAATAQRHGVDGLILATGMSGLLLAALGYLRLGSYIKFVPYPVTVGFTAGIAVIILASQVAPLLGLTLTGPEPGPFLEKLPALWAALPSASPHAVALAAATIAIIFGLKLVRPKWPGMLIAITLAGLATAGLNLPVETVASKFGGIPSGLPMPHLPEMNWAKVGAVLPDAIAFALLGSIESLLSAVVADGMTGRRHRSNCELVAQGVANVGSALFGGICVTGTIARTATNVRAGAHGPIAGMAHSGFLLLFMLFAAPLAGYIPLAALAGVLVTVAWNMAERRAFKGLITGSYGDAVVLLATFGLTVFRDLMEAIIVGVALGSIVIIHRMSRLTLLEHDAHLMGEDRPDTDDGERGPYHAADAADPDVVIYRVTGALFFGAAAIMDTALDHISDAYKVLVLDFSAAPMMDSSGAHAIEELTRKAESRSVKLYLTGTNPQVRQALAAQGVAEPHVRFAPSIDGALADRRARQT